MRNVIGMILLLLGSCSPSSGSSGQAQSGAQSEPPKNADLGGSVAHVDAGGSAGPVPVNTACPKVKDLARSCGIPIPDKECKPSKQCEDECTLAASCLELQDLIRGEESPALIQCFEQCD